VIAYLTYIPLDDGGYDPQGRYGNFPRVQEARHNYDAAGDS